MGTYYRAEIGIYVHEDKTELRRTLQEAVENVVYDAPDWSDSWDTQLFGKVECKINMADTPDDISGEIRDAVWKAAEQFVRIEINWYPTEVEPEDSFCYDDEDEYIKWLSPLVALAQAADPKNDPEG